MRACTAALLLLAVLALLTVPASAYRKRKGYGYKAASWSRPPEENLKIETMAKPKDCKVKTKNFDVVRVHYMGMLRDSKQPFDSSYARKEPLEFQLGAGRVIPGWEKGLLDMCVGEKRRLTIPPSLGYGARGYPPVIPGNSYLVFTTELVGIVDKKAFYDKQTAEAAKAKAAEAAAEPSQP